MVPSVTSHAAFNSAPNREWPINVKNTFINFDVPFSTGTAHRRATSCPRSLWSRFLENEASWERATQELCHAMTPKHSCQGVAMTQCLPKSEPMKEAAMGGRTSRRIRNNKAVKKPLAAGKENIAQGAVAAAEKAKEPATCEPGSWAKKLASSIAQPQQEQETAWRRKPSPESEVDAISEMSTASTAAPETPSSACEKRNNEEATWTSILAKKRTKPRTQAIDVASPSSSDSNQGKTGQSNQSSQETCAAWQETGGQSQEAQQSSGDSHRDDYSNRREAQHGQQRHSGYSNYSSYSGYSGYSASPKGLPHFRKIEVGIEDDSDFRVVQRLIGPRGKYVQDITEKCRGSKVWIIGKGSRSWEDSVGPLVVCVGATTGNEFENAVGLINELLERVRKEHRRFRRGAF